MNKSVESSTTQAVTDEQTNTGESNAVMMANNPMMNDQMSYGMPNQAGFNNGMGFPMNNMNGMSNMMGNGNWNSMNSMGMS